MTDRKARLAALAARAGRTKPEQPVVTEEEEEGEEDNNNVSSRYRGKLEDDEKENKEKKKPTVLFRNYVPTDTSLTSKIETTTGKDMNDEDNSNKSSEPIEDEPSPKRSRKSTASQQEQPKSALEEALEKAQQDVAPIIGEPTPSNNSTVTPVTTTTANAITKPKKINWDLKRDVQKKIDKLERRTQRAIVQLLKTRLEKEAEEEAEKDTDDDDDLD